MDTAFLLMSRHGGRVLIPIDEVCECYFSHLTPRKLLDKVTAGEIALPVTRIDPSSQKTAKGVHLMHLAAWLDARAAAAQKECDQLKGIGR